MVREERGSVSLLQRTLGIGYGRAARLVDFMAEDGIVGEYNGSQAREVLLSPADWDRMQGQEPEAEPAVEAPRKRRRSNVIRPDGDWEDRPSDLPDRDQVDADEVFDDDRSFALLRYGRRGYCRRICFISEASRPISGDTDLSERIQRWDGAAA